MENKEKQTQVIMTQNPADVIDLKEVFFTLVAHWKSIFLAALLGAAVFGAYHTFMLKPSYQADASIYICTDYDFDSKYEDPSKVTQVTISNLMVGVFQKVKDRKSVV